MKELDTRSPLRFGGYDELGNKMGSLLKILIFSALVWFIWRLLSPKPLPHDHDVEQNDLIEDMVSCPVCGNYTLKKNCGRGDCPFK